MAIARYLAMTADEFSAANAVPKDMAWMACHFSAYSTGLSNLPVHLPANSLLILDDSTPPDHQDPKLVGKILENSLKQHKCFGLLLDFQRPDCPQTMAIAEELIQMDSPVCVSSLYANELNCPVFLPPLPLTVPLSQYIAPWQGRQIWLDTALNCEQITVTESGSKAISIIDPPECPFEDKTLHCHYHIAAKDDGFCFTLQRTKGDLDALLAEAETLGISVAVGLYQELK